MNHSFQKSLEFPGRSALFLAASAASALAQTTTRVSVDSVGVQGNQLSWVSSLTALSADARYVTFESDATNIVAGDTNAAKDIFVHDVQTGATERVSLGSTGTQANNSSFTSSISADGRYVAFRSLASNLVAGDTNLTYDAFVRDRQGSTTERVSVATGGAQANGYSHNPVISGDGRFVIFASFASNLVAGDTNNTTDIFVRDRLLGTTERVSVDSSGAQANSFSGSVGQNGLVTTGAISQDGRYALFASSASNLVTGDTNGSVDVFVRDRQLGLTERVSVDTAGVEANGNSGSFFTPFLSSDGRYAVFSSLATNLVPGDTNAHWDIFVRDRQNGTTERASVDSAGTQSNNQSTYAVISGDGRYVAFSSYASNLVGGDTNAKLDVFVRDRQAGATQRVSIDSVGVQANGNSGWTGPSISADGRYVSFESGATNLVGGDTNLVDDVFLRDRSACPPPIVYCTALVSSSGCIPAMTSSGTASLANPLGFTAGANNLEVGQNGIMFFGTTGPNNAPFFGGTLCVNPTLYRLNVANAGGSSPCTGSLSYTLQDMLNHPTGGSLLVVGQVVCAQVWTRDPPAATTVSLSNGLQFQICL